ncbi:hypothetical protein [Streptomyces sp. NPDC052114]|uniref:hypothetical protein n=1 Tax=unclassified Streptomyces TaxID=2593676 RepID=UPI003432480C
MQRIRFDPPRRPGLPPRVRRLLGAARSTRFRLERVVAGRTRSGSGLPGRWPGGAEEVKGLLVPVHLSLRDSRTLNLALDAGDVPGEVRDARLVVGRGVRRIAVPLVYEPHTGARPLLTATATLRDMRDGVWRVTAEVRGGDGRVRRYGLAVAVAGAAPATPIAPHAPDPLTGTLVRVVAARGGRAVLQATRSLPRAELVRFVPRGDGITVHGRLVAGAAPGRAEAVRRRDGVVVPAEVLWRGTAFALRVPLAAMAGAGPGQWVWDFRVGPLPLGRWLSDVRDPSAAYPTPFRVVALPDGAIVRAHAHFTASGAFAVTCRDITDDLGQDITEDTGPGTGPRELAEETP